MKIHEDAIETGQQVLLVDELIAMGCTMLAAVDLVEQSGGSVLECYFIVDLPELGG